FRGALDVRATSINDEMKIAAAEALAELAREDVPDEVTRAYAGRKTQYGPEYIIPAPFDPRLIECIPPRVAAAAMASGVAGKPIEDFAEYRRQLSGRMNPTVATLSQMFVELVSSPRRVIFAEAEQKRMIRAALSFRDGGYGTPILVGQEEIVRARLKEMGIKNLDGLEIHSARSSVWNEEFADYLYARLNRRGFLQRDIRRLVHRDRNVFGASMVALGHADAMVTGITRHYGEALKRILLAVDAQKGYRPFGMAMMVSAGRTVFIADATVTERPTAEELADIAAQSAEAVRRFGHQPRVAFVSFSNFGNPMRSEGAHLRDAIRLLDQRGTDFEYDGEMSVDIALGQDMLTTHYPFSRLSGPANILIMPDLHSANISYKLVNELGGGKLIGPVLWGLKKSIQITRMRASATDILNMAGIAAMGSLRREEDQLLPGF
ncbi:MAG: phosphate acyltransferase, partial [Sphingomonadales bacterium]